MENENEVTESESISSHISTLPYSKTSVYETSSNCQPFNAMILSKMRFSIRFKKIILNLSIM